MIFLCLLVSVVVAVNAGYHEDVGISLAAKIKALEDQIMAEVPDMESRIVGGQVSAVHAHPYLAGLIIDLEGGYKISICGSSLVTATRLLTAAHCIEHAVSMEVVLGTPFLYYMGLRIQTDVFEAHPLYNRSANLAYDIAIVSLPEPVEFDVAGVPGLVSPHTSHNSHNNKRRGLKVKMAPLRCRACLANNIQPIGLPVTLEDVEIVGEWGIAAGFGMTNDNEKGVKKTALISQVRLEILNQTVCEENYGENVFPNSWVCTSGHGGVGTCGGDSGGPLVVSRDGYRKILIGITSFGTKLCEVNATSVFTRVASYLDYIVTRL